MNIIKSFNLLRYYCEAERYKGWDPYDGLNSKVAHAILPLNHSAILRLCIIQGFKRCPINLRRVAMVPKEYNAKGIGLFLQGYVNLYKLSKGEGRMTNVEGLRAKVDMADLREKICELADLLLDMRSNRMFPGQYHGACWGYNFDWQARRLFLFPAYTPTVVATNFCATALLEAYEVLKDEGRMTIDEGLKTKDEGRMTNVEGRKTNIEKYKEVALSAAEFVMQDLHRHQCDEGFLFSYSKLPGNDTVYNASLLGSRLLSYCYKYSGNEEYKAAARQSVLACCNGQAEDGSWIYGLLPVQSWKDSFHTGYNLDALIAYEEMTGDQSFHQYIERGFNYYISNFFEPDGTPKYYHNRKYPIDIHCPGQLMVTLARLHKFDDYRELADKVMNWAIKNMQDKKGFFYYQLKPGISSKISYMRWSNAFMFCAMSYFLLEEGKRVKRGEEGLRKVKKS